MIVTGLLSLLQILFLPGLILNALIKKESGVIVRLCFILAFSMLFNFILVVSLVALNAYSYIVILITILLESLILLFLYRKAFLVPIGQLFFNSYSTLKNCVVGYFNEESGNDKSKKIIRLIKWIAFVFACLTLGWVLYGFVSQIGTVFSKWDAVVSYNRWAGEWAKGLFPTRATEYPQLLPTNWSLTYVLTQSPVGVFAKLVQGVFPIMFVLAFFDLGLTYHSAGLLFGVPLSLLILKKFAGISLFEGYMDVPVTTFILLSFYMIFKDLHLNRYSQKTIWLSGIVILAAAMTKQPGTLAFGAWVLVNFFLLLSKNPGKIWDAIKKLLLPTILILLVIAAWYIFKINRDIVLGEESSIALTNAWAANDFKTGFWQVLLFRLKLMNLWILFIPILFVSLFFTKGEKKLLLLCFGIPYLLVTLCYGYLEAFLRYLTPISFVFAMSAGVIIDQLITGLPKLVDQFPAEKLKNNFRKWSKPFIYVARKIPQFPFWGILILGLGLIAVVGLKYPDSKVMRNYEYQQMGIGNRVINKYLVDFYKDKNPQDLTLTWYPFVNYLPGMEGRSITTYNGTAKSVSELLQQKDIHYVLLYNTTPVEVTDYMNSMVEKGQMILITDFGLAKDAVLYEIKR